MLICYVEAEANFGILGLNWLTVRERGTVFVTQGHLFMQTVEANLLKCICYTI